MRIQRPTEIPKKKRELIPYRYIIVLMMFACTTIAYATRVSWKLSLRHMQKPIPRYAKLDSRCKFPRQNLTFAPVSQKIFLHWPPSLLPQFSDAFIWCYIIAHFPAGILCIKYGGKIVLTISLLILCLFTLATPSILFYVTDSPYYVFFFRIVAGSTCGMVFPAVDGIIGNWVPARERGTMASIIFAGTTFGSGINTLLGNILIVETDKWSTVYYVYGSCLLAWIICWQIFGSSNYQTNSHVGKRERRYLDDKMEGHIDLRKKAIPWCEILKSLPLWALTINEFAHQIVFRLLSKELPNYLREALGMEMNRAYVIGSIPFLLCGFFTIVNGFISDFIINHDYVHPTTYRKICTTLGGIGPCINLISAYYAGCNVNTALFILFFGLSLMSFYYAGTRVNSLDLAPNFCGLVMAISSGFGSLSGVASMIILQKFNLRVNLYGWRDLYWTYLGVLAVSNIIYAIFGSAEVQPWNEIHNEELEEEDEDRDSPEFGRRIDHGRKRSGLDLQALEIFSNLRDRDDMFPEST